MDKNFEKKQLKKKSENMSDWYTDVILKAELADYGPAKGTMVIRPYGYAIWEQVQKVFDAWLKESGVDNAYFPLFIPMSLMQKEKEHIQGFSPELAMVTHGGGKKLAEPFVVRPTSETIMYHMFSKWISSHRDLPVKINQWNNVVRWEMRTYLFLRTSEFLWQEGHTAHESEAEAIEMALTALEWYRRIYEEYYAIPILAGVKSQSEKFAGAKASYSIEILMPDGKTLQAATSHNLGQNFSKPFNISFQDGQGNSQFVWQTSWGFSTRSLGGLFMIHGDDCGVIIPPKIAPVQVIVVPVYKSGEDMTELKVYIEELVEDLNKNNIRVKVDWRPELSVGRKFNDWEIKGVPLRYEIGQEELASKTVVVMRRDTLEKLKLQRDGLINETNHLLDTIQEQLLEKAAKFLRDNTIEVSSYDEFKEIMSKKRGFIRAFWCEDPDCELKIKQETKATTRVKTMGEEEKNGKCIYCGRPAKFVWNFAQAY